MADPAPPSGERPAQPRRVAKSAAKPAVRPQTVRRKPLIDPIRTDDREPELTEQIIGEVKRDLPGVLASLGVHAVVLLLFALIPILLEQPAPERIISLEWATAAPQRTQPQALVQLSAPIQLTRPTPAAAAPPRVEPAPTDDPAPQEVPVAPVVVSSSLGGRTQKTGPAAAAAGVNDESRQALDRALRWLAKQQRPDGRWSLDGPYADGATRTRFSTDVGATALALLAFLGDGHTHQSGEFTDVVGKGLTWLKTQQRSDGEIYDGSEEGEEPSVYSHAISTIVLCESLALTGDEQFRGPAVKAVAFLTAAQNPVRGGWRYRPLSESGEGDLSVTGWALMALHTARMAGLDVNPEAFLLASSFLDRCQEQPRDPSRYKYMPTYPPDRGQRASMTASGLLARQWLGWPRQYPPLTSGVSYLLSDEAAPEWDNGHRNVYAWYYQAQVLHNLGGEKWREWFARLQQTVVSRQQTTGKESGSWHPTRPAGSNHEWSAVVGRLYVTVMCVLILETPFRHAPLYEETNR